MSTEIIDPLLQLAGDGIPNIRFNVAKGLEIIGKTFGSVIPDGQMLVAQRIKPALEQLSKDSDADVQYYAARALRNIK